VAHQRLADGRHRRKRLGDGQCALLVLALELRAMARGLQHGADDRAEDQDQHDAGEDSIGQLPTTVHLAP
jgi:uncharacterized membrane protein YccC